MSPLTRLDSYDSAEVHWQNLLSNCTVDTLFNTPQWQKVWWEQFGNGAEMLMLCLEEAQGVEGLAPMVRRNGTISLIGDQDVCDYNDFLVSKGAESRFYPSLLDHLDTEQWEIINLPSLPEHSPTLTFLPGLARERGYAVEVEQEDVAPGVGLPSTWDAYLEILSKKNRHELRRKFRRLYTSGQESHYYKLCGRDEIETSLEDFFQLMRDSKQEKNHFLNSTREGFFKNIAREMASIGVLRLFFLEMNGERVASAMCFDYGPARLLYNSGFNPAYGYYSVGLLLKALCLRDAIEDSKAYFDFLRGSEPYKYDLGGQNRTLYQMVVRRI